MVFATFPLYIYVWIKQDLKICQKTRHIKSIIKYSVDWLMLVTENEAATFQTLRTSVSFIDLIEVAYILISVYIKSKTPSSQLYTSRLQTQDAKITFSIESEKLVINANMHTNCRYSYMLLRFSDWCN